MVKTVTQMTPSRAISVPSTAVLVVDCFEDAGQPNRNKFNNYDGLKERVTYQFEEPHTRDH